MIEFAGFFRWSPLVHQCPRVTNFILEHGKNKPFYLLQEAKTERKTQTR